MNDFKQLVGEEVIEKQTGVVTTVESYFNKASVKLSNGVIFEVNSKISENWELFEPEKKWNIYDDGTPGTNISRDIYQLKKLKTKILKDIENMNRIDIECALSEDVVKLGVKGILDKRFGF